MQALTVRLRLVVQQVGHAANDGRNNPVDMRGLKKPAALHLHGQSVVEVPFYQLSRPRGKTCDHLFARSDGTDE